MTLDEYKSASAKYNKTLDDLSDKLNSFPKLSDGMVTDEARKTDAYLQAKKSYNFIFARYREFNSLKESKAFSKRLHTEKRNALLKR
jgi:hypothetical protein